VRVLQFLEDTFMKHFKPFLFACATASGLSACGGGDTADRLDIANPAVRFVHASPIAPNLTLYRDTVAQAQATDIPYLGASNYYDVDMSTTDWSVKTTVASLTLGSVSVVPVRGNKYTIVALPASSADSSVYLITDPYNKPLGSSSTRLRVMNASFNASNIDVYMNPVGTDITPAGVTPTIAATAYKTSGPASGTDSVDIPGGTYQLTVTLAGTKTALFKGPLTFDTNRDILLLTVPDTLLPGAIKVLVKTEGTTGTVVVPAI
jgi:Domain of unknown function (DUF4397)